jgi:putative membrane protein
MLLVAPVSVALAQQSGGNANPPPAYYYPPQHMWGGWHAGMFFGPLLWIIVIFGLVALFGRYSLWGHRGYHRRPGGALDILEERFARGEIDKAEFEEKRKALGR